MNLKLHIWFYSFYLDYFGFYFFLIIYFFSLKKVSSKNMKVNLYNLHFSFQSNKEFFITLLFHLLNQTIYGKIKIFFLFIHHFLSSHFYILQPNELYVMFQTWNTFMTYSSLPSLQPPKEKLKKKRS